MRTKPLPLLWHLIGLVATAVVPVILFSGAVMWKVAQQEQEALQSQVDEKAVQLALAVESELQLTIAALEVLALSNPVRQADFAAFHNLAKRVVSSHRGWANVALLGPNGEHLVSTRLPYGSALPPLLRPDLPQQAARSGKPLTSDMVPAVIAQRPLTVVYVPVIEDGRAKFVLAAATEPPDWRALIRAQLLSRFDAVLLDRQGNTVSSTVDDEARLGKDAGMLVARRTSPQSGWTVVVYRLPDSHTALSTTLGPLAAGFILLLTSGILLAVFFGGRIAGAMQRHAASVRAVGSGEAPLPVQGRIAEIRQAHEALEDAARLLAARWAREQEARAAIEKSDRAKDEFIALLSHELRTPIATTMNALSLLADPRAGEGGAAHAKGIIERQTAQMARLVDDLLDVARISRGKIELRRTVVNLGDVVTSVANDHREAMRKAGVEFMFQPATEPVWVEGDAARLAQIIGNLLHNAAKFTPAGGRVTLSVASSGDTARISVRDTGAGIEPDLLDSMFEPFVQGAQGRIAAKGLGVGLALVKSLTELHGGRVHAASAGPGRGAEFVVTLPTHPEGNRAERRSELRQPATGA